MRLRFFTEVKPKVLLAASTDIDFKQSSNSNTTMTCIDGHTKEAETNSTGLVEVAMCYAASAPPSFGKLIPAGTKGKVGPADTRTY
jgi:hypothetical protein